MSGMPATLILFLPGLDLVRRTIAASMTTQCHSAP